MKQKEINFTPSPKQYEAWQYLTDHVTTELGYGGAAYGGKSYLGSFFLMAMCLTYPGTGWLMGRKELTNLKRTSLLTFFKVCEDYGVEAGVDFQLNQQTNIINFINKSQIFLLDLSHQPSDPLYTRLGGLELTGSLIEESNEVEEMAITIARTRIGRRLNEKYNLTPKQLETFNPDKGHVYSRFYKPSKEGRLPEYRHFIKALPTDNPYATEEYLNQLRNADPITVQRLYYGNFEYDDDPSALMNYDAINDLFTNTIIPTEDKYITADIARYGSDKIVIMVWKGWRVIKIVTLSKIGIDETAQYIKTISQEERVPYSNIIIDEDGVGGGVYDILKGIKGFMAQTSPFETYVMGRKENYANLKAQCTFKFAEKVNAHLVAITCDDPTIRNTIIEELEQVKSKNAEMEKKLQLIPKDEIKTVLGRSPDYADALIMRMYFDLGTSNKLREVKQFIPNYKNQNYGAKRPGKTITINYQHPRKGG